MHRRKWPILRLRDKPVLHRIEPAMPQMRRHIGFVANVMLPKTSLPNARITFSDLRRATQGGVPPHRCTAGGVKPHPTETPAETRFDGTHACAIIPVSRGQGPDAMHVVRQNDPGVDPEGSFGPRHGDGLAQSLHFIAQKRSAVTLQGHGEKDRSAGDSGAKIARHSPI